MGSNITPEHNDTVMETDMQDMIKQNDESIKELERICQIDDASDYDPRELEGILAPYSDSESSVEWIRSVRDRT